MGVSRRRFIPKESGLGIAIETTGVVTLELFVLVLLFVSVLALFVQKATMYQLALNSISNIASSPRHWPLALTRFVLTVGYGVKTPALVPVLVPGPLDDPPPDPPSDPTSTFPLSPTNSIPGMAEPVVIPALLLVIFIFVLGLLRTLGRKGTSHSALVLFWTLLSALVAVPACVFCTAPSMLSPFVIDINTVVDFANSAHAFAGELGRFARDALEFEARRLDAKYSDIGQCNGLPAILESFGTGTMNGQSMDCLTGHTWVAARYWFQSILTSTIMSAILNDINAWYDVISAYLTTPIFIKTVLRVASSYGIVVLLQAAVEDYRRITPALASSDDSGKDNGNGPEDIERYDEEGTVDEWNDAMDEWDETELDGRQWRPEHLLLVLASTLSALGHEVLVLDRPYTSASFSSALDDHSGNISSRATRFTPLVIVLDGGNRDLMEKLVDVIKSSACSCKHELLDDRNVHHSPESSSLAGVDMSISREPIQVSEAHTWLVALPSLAAWHLSALHVGQSFIPDLNLALALLGSTISLTIKVLAYIPALTAQAPTVLLVSVWVTVTPDGLFGDFIAVLVYKSAPSAQALTVLFVPTMVSAILDGLLGDFDKGFLGFDADNVLATRLPSVLLRDFDDYVPSPGSASRLLVWETESDCLSRFQAVDESAPDTTEEYSSSDETDDFLASSGDWLLDEVALDGMDEGSDSSDGESDYGLNGDTFDRICDWLATVPKSRVHTFDVQVWMYRNTFKRICAWIAAVPRTPIFDGPMPDGMEVAAFDEDSDHSPAQASGNSLLDEHARDRTESDISDGLNTSPVRAPGTQLFDESTSYEIEDHSSDVEFDKSLACSSGAQLLDEPALDGMDSVDMSDEFDDSLARASGARLMDELALEGMEVDTSDQEIDNSPARASESRLPEEPASQDMDEDPFVQMDLSLVPPDTTAKATETVEEKQLPELEPLSILNDQSSMDDRSESESPRIDRRRIPETLSPEQKRASMDALIASLLKGRPVEKFLCPPKQPRHLVEKPGPSILKSPASTPERKADKAVRFNPDMRFKEVKRYDHGHKNFDDCHDGQDDLDDWDDEPDYDSDRCEHGHDHED